jgi:hypothetical protein
VSGRARLAFAASLGGALVALAALACEATDVSPLENGQCPQGEKACFVNGKEQCVGLSDPATGCTAPNCVSCDVKVANAVATCSATLQCTIAACNAGYLDCDMLDSNGCEVDSQIDIGNCGYCGVGCGTEAHSEPVCLNGVCQLSCDPGYADCDLKYSNGCEVALASDATNCGACGTACTGSQACADAGCQ